MRVPGFTDQIAVARRQREDIRRLRSQKRCHTESKTVVVSGPVEAGRYIPPYRVAIDTDTNNPEYKTLYQFPGGALRVGTCTVQWQINGVDIGDPQDVTTTPDANPVTIDPADWPDANLNDGDRVQPTFTAASVDAADYDGPVVMTTVAA